MTHSKTRIALVTGATSGIGRATAAALSAEGMHVVLCGRDRESAERSAAEIGAEPLAVDLGSMRSVRAAAQAFRARHDRLHVLINCAGISLSERSVTEDGFETTFAVNHLGHFLLTSLLLDPLRAGAPARVIDVSSHGHTFGRMHWDDLHLARGYSGMKAYSQSKLANVLFTYELARRLEGTGVTANSMDPGVVATPMNKRRRSVLLFRMSWWAAGFLWMRKPEKVARALVSLATAPEHEGTTGTYFDLDRPKRSSKLSYDTEAAQRLWRVSEELTGSAR
jgi:retinol dehydrogenase-14